MTPVLGAALATLAVCGLAILGLEALRLRMEVETASSAVPPATPVAWRSPTLPPPRTTLFQQVHVVDVLKGALRRDQDVLVRDGLIGAIAPAGALMIPGAGKYLMPGIIDTHVHVAADDQLFLYLAAGVTTVQAMPFVVPGFSAIDELRHLHRAGLSTAAMLRAATHGGAALLRRKDERGRVEAGFRADLILVDADPLADVEHVGRRSGVMVAGRWLPESWLQKRLPRY
jgi:cytosine/adenosine deaminase-related metal-dependent hydrolase